MGESPRERRFLRRGVNEDEVRGRAEGGGRKGGDLLQPRLLTSYHAWIRVRFFSRDVLDGRTDAHTRERQCVGTF